MVRYEIDLTDSERSVVEPLIPPPSRMGRPRIFDMRELPSIAQFMLWTGRQWQALSKCLPPFTPIQVHCYSRCRTGILERMPAGHLAHARDLTGRSEEQAVAAIDIQPAKAAECRGQSGCDAGTSVEGRKHHVTVNAERFPNVIATGEASMQDRVGGPDMILEKLEEAPQVTTLRADGGCAGSRLEGVLARLGLGSALKIAQGSKETRDFILFRRWVHEQTFLWLSRCGRLANDHERRLENSVAWTQLAAGRFLMTRMARGQCREFQ